MTTIQLFKLSPIRAWHWITDKHLAYLEKHRMACAEHCREIARGEILNAAHYERAALNARMARTRMR